MHLGRRPWLSDATLLLRLPPHLAYAARHPGASHCCPTSRSSATERVDAEREGEGRTYLGCRVSLA